MILNIEKTPFSRAESVFAVSADRDKNIYIRTIYGQWEDDKLFQLIPMKNEKIQDYSLEALPWSLNVLGSDDSYIRIYMKDSRGLVIEASGLDYILKYIDSPSFVCSKALNHVKIASSKTNTFVDCIVANGSMRVEAPLSNGGKKLNQTYTDVQILASGKHTQTYINVNSEEIEVILPLISPQEDITKIKEEYLSWINPWKRKDKSFELALYIMWSSIAPKGGFYKRPTMLMSKNWMHYVWSWDHCFNSLALLKTHPGLSWDQYMTIFDNQLNNGKLPDVVHETFVQSVFTKPPVHGLFLLNMFDRGLILDGQEMKNIYSRLEAWTNWWFNFRDDDKDGICQYNHGNECGWDNSTVFDAGLTAESPDLTAFLLLQVKCLGELAEALNYKERALVWADKYKEIYNKFIEHFWRVDRFVSVENRTHVTKESKSFLNFMPLVLGDLLDKERFQSLVSIVKDENNYLAPFGIYTEAYNSDKYSPGNMYWRGPVWAPVVYLIVDGLRRGGEAGLAKDVAARFVKAVNGKDGIYENYNAFTGEGYDDPSYTWTASVYIMLREEFDF